MPRERISMATPNYHLSEPLVRTSSCDLVELRRWIKEKSGRKGWTGRIYVAKTIRWTDTAGFYQTGCAPNFTAGWWSLCCCKHKLLRYRALGTWLAELENCPLFIFTLASQDDGDWQPLVSVAKITKYFNSPEGHAQFVCAETKLSESRLSRLTQNEHHNNQFKAWLFGDCHSNTKGELGRPVDGHVHRYRGQDETDLWKMTISQKRANCSHKSSWFGINHELSGRTACFATEVMAGKYQILTSCWL